MVTIPFAISATAVQPLSEIRAREQAEKQLRDEAAFTSKVCGTSVRARIDWSTAQDWPANANIAKSCDGALSALEAVCRSNKSKGSKVKSFVCKGDGSGPGLSGSTLVYGASPGSKGFGATKSMLDDAL